MTIADQHQNFAPPTTRASVLHVLQEKRPVDDDNDSLNSLARSLVTSPSYNGTTDEVAPLPPDASLEDIRNWLDVQCDIEQCKADWTDEYGRNQQDGLKDVHSMAQGPDITVLDRIRRGKGPRSAKYEDLLWPLRSKHSRERSKYSKHPKDESYGAMEQVLRGWNKHVATACENPTTRKALIDAMCERVDFLDLLLPQRRSADTYDPTADKLLRAIHAYWPETAAFRTTETPDLLIIILAHIGFTIPDIDEGLKHLIFYTLVTERIHVAHEVNATERREREEDITRAKQQGYTKRVAKYEQKMKDWQRDIFKRNCDIIADKVKSARRNVATRALEELQTLTVLQTAQKMVLNDRLSGSSALPSLCALSDSRATALVTAADDQLPPLPASAALASQNFHEMEYIARVRIHARAKKFAGLDVAEDKRQRLVEERMGNPGTVEMMGNAIQGIAETRTKAKEMLKAMETMDVEIDEVLSKTQEMMEVYEVLDKLVGPESLTDVDTCVDSADVE